MVQYSELDVKFIRMDQKSWSKILNLIVKYKRKRLDHTEISLLGSGRRHSGAPLRTAADAQTLPPPRTGGRAPLLPRANVAAAGDVANARQEG